MSQTPQSGQPSPSAQSAQSGQSPQPGQPGPTSELNKLDFITREMLEDHMVPIIPEHNCPGYSDPIDLRLQCLFACIKCKLILNLEQWGKYGCKNCGWKDERNKTDMTRSEHITNQWSGIVASTAPQESWTARVNKIEHHIPGCYAVQLNHQVNQM